MISQNDSDLPNDKPKLTVFPNEFIQIDQSIAIFVPFFQVTVDETLVHVRMAFWILESGEFIFVQFAIAVSVGRGEKRLVLFE